MTVTAKSAPVTVRYPVDPAYAADRVTEALAELRATGSYKTSLRPTTHARRCEQLLIDAKLRLP